MPRKTNPGMSYDADDMYDDYGDYDDYDDYGDEDDGGEGNSYNYEVQRNGMSSQQDKTVNPPQLWCCPICMHDNDECSLACDMCGVLQDSSVKVGSDNMAKGMSFEQDKTVKKPQVWRCSICTYDNDKSSLACDMCGVFQDSSVKVGNDNVARASTGISSSSTEEKRISTFPPNNQVSNSSCMSSKPSHLNGVESSSIKEFAEIPVLASNLNNLKLDTNTTSISKDSSRVQYHPEKWMLIDQEEGGLNQLNLAIVGHVDSGKSTLSGRLLHLLGRISKKEMHKFEKEAKLMGKGSFAYAWAMDESNDERERGVTMTVAVAYFDSKRYRVVLLDSPGHKDFIPNMISGTTQADAAVLVVDATRGSFEAGMDGFGIGQTREHAQLIRSFGIEQIIIPVNKMDMVDYSKERFDFIKLQLGTFLRSCGFKESAVMWVPLSVMENQNLVTNASDSRLLSWYQGVCLLDAIDSLQPPQREFSKPLRMPICDVTKLHSMGQFAASGKLETGAIRNGSKVLVMPSGDLATVKSIERDSSPCSVARAGDNVSVSLLGIDWGKVMPGGVLCHPDFPVALATSLELKILVLEIMIPLLIGSQVEFHIHHTRKAARVAKIISLLDSKTGKVSKTAPRVLKSKQSAIIEVTLDEAVCVEEFSKCRALGRAFLRSSGNTIAVGVINRVL